VRSAILDWISGHDAQESMARHARFMPSGIAMPAIDTLRVGEDNDELP